MSKFFNQTNSSPRQLYEQQYRTSRANLLLVVIFTAINLLLLVTNANSYFLFSAYIPYFIAGTGMLITGRFPDDYYTEDMIFLDGSVFVIMLIVAVAITLLYLLAWFMSKNRRSGWLIFALVLFGIDTVLMFSGFSLDSILDLLFHAWVIYYLAIGISAANKLKYLPAEPVVAYASEISAQGNGAEEGGNGDGSSNKAPDSPIIRMADNTVKHRILLQKNVLNYDICYRRVKRTNELVINGRVYDEYTALAEQQHILCAVVDGHYIQVGLKNTRSFISFDGEIVAQKLRLY